GTLRPELAAPGRRARCLLAGTHPKHALLCDGALQNFRALLTGELFEVLARESLLAASVTHEVAAGPPDLAMFRAGVACARERGAEAALFQVRARHLLLATAKEANTWFLSGVLVGGELSRLECEVVGATLALIGDPMRLTLYCAALEELGLAVRFGAPILIALNDAVVAGQEKLMRAHAHQLAA
ncbi:MAG: 2-dehydro-3-deoxygalactonokinase, partial [Undibacterium sp.]|nr:2-dehydro-3-deoxygalactonokinase [Opitutaceae bacterium]